MSEQQEQMVDQQPPQRMPVVAGRSPVGGLIPTDMDQMWRMAQAFAASGLMPKGLDKPEAVFTAVQMGLEIGLSPMQAVQNIAVINGRPSLWGDAALGLVEASGLLEDFQEFQEGQGEALKAVCIAKRRGRNPSRREFSIADARQADLLIKPGPWKQYPKRMLQMRARSWALRDNFADVLKGLRVAEEQMDVVEMGFIDGAYTPAEPDQPAGPTLDEMYKELFSLANAKGLADEDQIKNLANYIKASAKHYKLTEDELLVKALPGFEAKLWPGYLKWAGCTFKPAATAPEQAPANATVEMATDEQHKAIIDVLAQINAAERYQCDEDTIIEKLGLTRRSFDWARGLLNDLVKSPPVWTLVDEAMGCEIETKPADTTDAGKGGKAKQGRLV